MKIIFYCFSFSFILFYNSIFAQSKSDAICGTWFTKEQKGQIEIYANSGKFEGKLTWIKDQKNSAGNLKLDEHNPDKLLKQKKLLGKILLTNFEYKDNIWQNGSVYDPESGNTYSGQIKLLNTNEIEVRGYLGFSLLGRSEIWTRVSQ